jgi:hypothetical protein
MASETPMDRLAEALSRLAEAQARTGERMDQLVATQARTDAALKQLAHQVGDSVRRWEVISRKLPTSSCTMC